MRRTLFLLAGVIFLTCAIDAQLPKELDDYIADAQKRATCPGLAVAVVKDGKLLAAKGYGVRELGKPELVDENTMFDAASLSKSLTAAVIATLVDEGKMRWDDPIRRHLPEIEFADPYRTANVTIRDVLSHRLGLEQGNFMMRFSNYDTAEVIRRLRFLEERDAFRTSMIYSNVAYAAAGEAAARAAKTPFLDLLRTRLLQPLGMNDSTVGIDHNLAPNHASSHGMVDGVHRPIRTRKLKNIAGANALNSTAKDLATWLLFSLGDGTWKGKRIISAEAMAEMQSPQNIIATTAAMRAARGVEFFGAYGLGWQVMDHRGRKLIWHSGGADGMPVYMCMLPAEKIGVVVLTNSWEAGVLHGAIAARILDTLLGLSLKDNAGETIEAQKRANASITEPAHIPNTKPSKPLEAYAGTYVDKLHGDMVVRHENGKLTMQFGGGEIADLEHWHHDVFRVRWHDRVYVWADTLAAFALDAEGTPRRFEMKLGRDTIRAARP